MGGNEELGNVLSRSRDLIKANRSGEALALVDKQEAKLAAHPELLKIKARALTGLQRYQASFHILHGLNLEFPNDVGVLVNLAMNLNLMRDHGSAIEYAEKAVKLRPQNVRLLLNLASTYRADRRAGSAITVLQRARAMAPDQANVTLLLSELLLEQGAYLQVLELLKQLAESPLRSMLLLDCYRRLNWYDKAQELVADITPTLANQDEYYKALFVTKLRQLGEFTKAQELLNGPAPFQSPQLLLAYIQTVFLDADSLLQLVSRVVEGSFANDDETALLFALSEKLLDCRQNEKALELLTVANQKQEISGSEQQEIGQVFENIEKIFITWKDKIIPKTQSSVPIFIVGMPRSGTTLVECILASHSQVFAAGETVFLGGNLNGQRDPALSHADSIKYLEEMSGWSDQRIKDISDGYLNQLKQHSHEAPHIVDKMPHNFLHLGVIRKIFPNAKIIHCVKNPVATCYSIYRQHLTSFHAYSTDLQFLAEYYNKYRKLMEFWKANVRDLNLIEVSYDSLVTDFEPVVRKLLADCDFTFEQNCLNFHQQKRVVSTSSARQVRNRIYTTSLTSWREHEHFLQPLLDAFPQGDD